MYLIKALPPPTNIFKIISMIIHIINITFNKFAIDDIPASFKALTSIVNITISTKIRNRNDTTLANVFQRKNKKFIVFRF